MKSPPITAALTLSLTGRYERQGTEAAEAMRLWAEAAGVRLILVDDQGSKEVALRAYGGWIDTADLLIGPYASGLVRRSIHRRVRAFGGPSDRAAFGGNLSLPLLLLGVVRHAEAL